MTAYDDLAWAIVVRHSADLPVGGHCGDVVRGFDVDAEQRRHRSHSDRYALLHRPAAALDEPGRVGDRQRAGCGQCRVFTERMTGNVGGVMSDIEAVAFKDANDCKASREQRRLCVLGQHQFLFGTIEHQPRQMLG